ncbi:MAG: F0F1 ATP synthase subunit epsilon [Desulfuromonadaceae bacterium]
MAEKMKLEIVTPYKKIVDTEVDEVTATGKLGEFGILPGHAPFLTSLDIGEFVFKNNGVTEHMSLNWGYFEVRDDKIIVLVETAEIAADIDVERAKAALGRAEEALKKLTFEDKQFKVYESALQRALIRMQVAGKTARK